MTNVNTILNAQKGMVLVITMPYENIYEAHAEWHREPEETVETPFYQNIDLEVILKQIAKDVERFG